MSKRQKQCDEKEAVMKWLSLHDLKPPVMWLEKSRFLEKMRSLLDLKLPVKWLEKSHFLEK